MLRDLGSGVISAGVGGRWWCAWRNGRAGRYRRHLAIFPGFEPAIDQESESHDHEKTSDAEGGARVSSGQGDQNHQPQANADQGNAAPAMSSGRSISGLIGMELLMGHGALETAGIDLRRGHQPLFDHRNPLADETWILDGIVENQRGEAEERALRRVPVEVESRETREVLGVDGRSHVAAAPAPRSVSQPRLGCR